MNIKSIRKLLLEWYSIHKRDLPWRKTKDPYRIWISESMLQQTRVDTVIPFYNRFLKRFPTSRSLASSNEQEVLKMWEGLGYYSRARNLLAAAREINTSYNGALPSSSAELQKLPGFGPYTSAAVASIAFDEPIAAIDGNVKRVISRLFATHSDLESFAQNLVDPNNPSDFNQAMMELGALICTPNNPDCPACPVQKHCLAFQKLHVDDYPQRQVRKAPKEVHSVSVILQRDGKNLLVQRSSKGQFGGLWEFPTFESNLGHNSFSKLKVEFEKKYGLKMRSLKKIGKFTHQLTHRTIHVTVFKAEGGDWNSLKAGVWVPNGNERKYPFSRLQQKVAELAAK